jgi:predicted NUDIX family NTP pyrophosphohydrolase
MKKQSAGVLLYRKKENELQVLIAHNGGPFFAHKDEGWWTIPKGELEEGENPKQAAGREFREELGVDAPKGEWIELGTIEQKNRKIVYAWAVEGDIDAGSVKSNTVEKEWPPKSGKVARWPEIDKVEWFNLHEASRKLNIAQVEFIKRLAQKLGVELGDGGEDAEQQELL